MDFSKYHKDAPFTDPVVRCDSCNRIVLREQLKKIGCCPHCGGRRVKELRIFDEKELEQMQRWEVDPEFLKLFEKIDE